MARIWDHRGREVRLYGTGVAGKPGDVALEGEADEEVRREMAARTSAWRTVAIVFGLLMLLPLCATLLGNSTWIELCGSWIVLIIAGGVVLWLLARGSPRQEPNRMIRAMLASRRCAQCGYDVSGVKEEADGCTVCPECAAAWKIAMQPPRE